MVGGLETPLSAAVGQDFAVSSSALLRVLGGVVVATKCTNETAVKAVETWIAWSGSEHAPLDWLTLADAAFPTTMREDGDDNNYPSHIARLTVAVAHLCEASRRNAPVPPGDLDRIWSIVRDALTGTTRTTQPLGAAVRSSQGFLHVPLCSIIKDGNIDELFRLHVWLPGRVQGGGGSEAFAVHSHQPFAQSWILAGEGTDHPYVVESVDNIQDATHARYALSWSGKVERNGADTDDTGTTYKTHQTASTVRNTGGYVRATPLAPATHGPGSTYTIPAAAYHWSEAPPDALHATLFYFDASRGFVKEADVLGPIDVKSHTQYRDPAGVTPAELTNKVEIVRQWEARMSQAREHARRAEWEQALRELDKTLVLTASRDTSDSATATAFPNAARYRRIVQGELGSTNRRFGRYSVAAGFLEAALGEMDKEDGDNGGDDNSSSANGPQRLDISGELGVVYRHMGRLGDAERVLQMQYDTALALGAHKATCRAIGNLGMVNYELSQLARDEKDETRSQAWLTSAILQLEERVDRARRLRSDPSLVGDTSLAAMVVMWESIGLQRLSLCYAATGKPGDTHRGVQVSEAAFALTSTSPDPTVVAMTSLFLGRALVADGDRKRAATYLSGALLPAGRCTPAIALCKEPSAEHRTYLRELIAVLEEEAKAGSTTEGAGLDAVDENGYTALDYCTFNSDEATEALVVKALRHQLYARADWMLTERRAEARLRKGYRELFQETLRPVLLGGKPLNFGWGHKRDKEDKEDKSSKTDKAGIADRTKDTIARLRDVYAHTLGANSWLPISSPLAGYRGVFDELKFVPYRAFAAAGHLPGAADNLVRPFVARAFASTDEHDARDVADAVDYIIFISYRWINVTRGAISPDDAAHTQYRRICAAVEAFLRLHPEVNHDRLGLWVDHACVDQANPAPGIAALPMLVAQCNAVISLISTDYYDRAWCAVEVMMVQVLRRAYGLHQWYEHVVDADGEGTLRSGPMDMQIVMANKALAFETDRHKILFLERQTKLLG